MHVVTHTSPYYKDGPSQLAGPQGELREGTRVIVIGREGSYAHVWTLDGIDAYVWDRSLVSIWEWHRRQSADSKPAEDDFQLRRGAPED